MSQDWTMIDTDNPTTWPPEDKVVDTLDSGGAVQPLVRKGRLFFFPDLSMYVYYVPKAWKP